MSHIAPTRRVFLQYALGVPALIPTATAATSYSWKEIDRMLASGDVKGKLSKGDLPTPALVLDLDAFESNVRKMTSYVRSTGRALRPHGKTHKCPEIAKYLIKQGAVGCCAAKLSEAEAFAANGVTGLLVTTQVATPNKIERAVALSAKQPDTMFSVDDAAIVRNLDAAAKSAGIQVKLMADLNVGNRTGIQPGEDAIKLIELIDSLPNVHFSGLQAYAGHASHTKGFEARKKVSQEAMAPAVETRQMLQKKGIDCPLLTGGSTGTYNIDSQIDGINELQPGSFVVMDVDYGKIGGADGSDQYHDFQYALSVVATVVSRPHADTAIVDAGYKALATDRPFGPDVRSPDGASYKFAGDEHGRLTLMAGARDIKVGDRAELIVPHCDPNINLYDRLFCVRGGQVEAVWKIAARGMSQ